MTPSPFLLERFDQPRLDPRLQWMHEPPRWSLDAPTHCLRLHTLAGTDFWRRTHYGFDADNGHLLACPVQADAGMTLTAHVRWQPRHQYDQAGLMVRVSADCWIKTSVEHEPDGLSRLGVVVTNHGYSDWSTQDLPQDPRGGWFRIVRASGDYTVLFSLDGRTWTQLRIARLHPAPTDVVSLCGVYACSPKGGDFVAEFSEFQIELVRQD